MANDRLFMQLLELLAGEHLPCRFAADSKITCNGRPVTDPGEALAGLTGIGDYRIMARDVADVSACLAAQLWFDDQAAVCAVRIEADQGALTECEVIRGPSRFPGQWGVDARFLTVPRACFSEDVPPERRMSREALMSLAQGYYDAVNHEDPSLALLDPLGGRVEQGTLITGNPAFHFEFYEELHGQALPNFGLWTAREQFHHGLWNADEVPQVRFASVEPRTGLVCAFMTYRPWGKRDWAELKGGYRVGPLGGGDRRVALNAMEVFKIDHGSILAMESVWSMESADWLNPWS